MHVRHLSLVDFRSYAVAELPFAPGVTTILGPNGQGKTNLVEAVGYVATLASHRVATDQPLVRFGTERAFVRAAVIGGGRQTLIELEINPGRANRARVNRSPVPRARDVLGVLRTVFFAPEDLALVKGDPAGRRAFLDDLLVARAPRWSAVRADYERILRQRNALLKSAAPLLRPGSRRHRRAGAVAQHPASDDPAASALHTLDVWNSHLADVGSALLHARLQLLHDLRPHLEAAYTAVSGSGAVAAAEYRPSLREPVGGGTTPGAVPPVSHLREHLLDTFEHVRPQEVERGMSLAGPHRDELLLTLGPLPAKGYASHGESWSLALALKLAAYQLLRQDLGEDPVLVLDDVFAELDTGRRQRLADLVSAGEQVLVTAAVPDDVPESLRRFGATYAVTLGEVERVVA